MAQTFDYRTLYLSVTLTAFAIAVAMLYVWRVHRREPAIAWWAAGFLVCALSTLPVSVDPALLPNVTAFSSITVFSNVLNLAGTACLYAGTAIFVGRPLQTRLLTTTYAFAFAMIIWWTFAQDWRAMRALGYSIAATLTLLLMARDLWTTASGPQTALYRTVAGCWTLLALSITQRCYGIFVAGSDAQLQSPNGHQLLHLGISQFVFVFGAVGHLLMASQRLQLRLDALAHRDELTGLLNRRAFYAMFGTDQGTARTPRNGALLALDIDHFKSINDRYGHAAGDVVLRSVAETLQAQLRDGDVFARAGGEEFWIYLRDVDTATAMRIGERLRKAVAAQAVIIAGAELRTTISIGLLNDADGAPEELSDAIRRADGALYAAKRQGRNRVVAARDAGPNARRNP